MARRADGLVFVMRDVVGSGDYAHLALPAADISRIGGPMRAARGCGVIVPCPKYRHVDFDEDFDADAAPFGSRALSVTVFSSLGFPRGHASAPFARSAHHFGNIGFDAGHHFGFVLVEEMVGAVDLLAGHLDPLLP